MNQELEPFIDKALECMAGARSELKDARYNNAANRSYYAAYNAAIVALLRAGLSSHRWEHDAVQALFSREIVQRRRLHASAFRSVLPNLSTIRVKADYGVRTVSHREALRAVDRASDFVTTVLGRSQ